MPLRCGNTAAGGASMTIERSTVVDDGNSRPTTANSTSRISNTRKNFPASGRYRSAGWHPAEETDASYVEFAHTVGLDLAESWPKPLAAQREQLDDFHFLVGLGVGARERIGPVPFHTTVLEWPVDVAAPPDAVYRALAPRIRELMEQLRGEQAS